MAATLRLMADYNCFPPWWAGDRVGNVDPNTLPLTPELKMALHAWAKAYERTLNQDYPPESGFRGAEEAGAFEAEGRRLWRELRGQLHADYHVVYFSNRDGRLHEWRSDWPG